MLELKNQHLLETSEHEQKYFLCEMKLFLQMSASCCNQLNEGLNK